MMAVFFLEYNSTRACLSLSRRHYSLRSQGQGPPPLTLNVTVYLPSTLDTCVSRDASNLPSKCDGRLALGAAETWAVHFQVGLLLSCLIQAVMPGRTPLPPMSPIHNYVPPGGTIHVLSPEPKASVLKACSLYPIHGFRSCRSACPPTWKDILKVQGVTLLGVVFMTNRTRRCGRWRTDPGETEKQCD